jgi:intermembrane space import and assembly protein 40
MPRDMQNCFRKHPEIYGSELDSDADDEEELTADAADPSHAATDSTSPSKEPTTSSEESMTSQIPSAATSANPSSTNSTASPSRKAPQSRRAEKGTHYSEPSSQPRRTPELNLVPEEYKPDGNSSTEHANHAAQHANSQEPLSESESLVPKAAFDAGDENTKVLGRK